MAYGREHCLSLRYVEQTSAPSMISICGTSPEGGVPRLPEEEGTGPEPKWQQIKPPVSCSSGIATVNSRRQTARRAKRDTNLFGFFFNSSSLCKCANLGVFALFSESTWFLIAGYTILLVRNSRSYKC